MLDKNEVETEGIAAMARVLLKEDLPEPTELEANEFCEKVRQWLDENPEIAALLPHRHVLVPVFAKRCKYDFTKTTTKIGDFCRGRSQAPEWFENRDPLNEKLAAILALGCFLPFRMPYKPDKGESLKEPNKSLVILIRAAAHDPDIHSQDDVIKVMLMILDLLIFETGITDTYAIIDMEGVKLSHAKVLMPSLVRKLVYCWKNYSTRPKRIDFIRAPSYVNLVLDIFRQFTTAKMRNRICVHHSDSFSSIYKEVPQCLFPIEYGGNTDTVPELIKFWEQRIIENQAWFLNKSSKTTGTSNDKIDDLSLD